MGGGEVDLVNVHIDGPTSFSPTSSIVYVSDTAVNYVDVDRGSSYDIQVVRGTFLAGFRTRDPSVSSGDAEVQILGSDGTTVVVIQGDCTISLS